MAGGHPLKSQVYNLIYMTVLVIIAPWLIYRSLRTGRYRSGVRQKLFGLRACELQTRFSAPTPTIWLHGVSVGEVQLLASFVKKLRQEIPSANLALSTTTESGMQLARQLGIEAELFFFPFDFSWAIKNTLNVLKPDMIVLGELEMWPNLIQVSHAKNVPLVVINGRLSENSFRGYQRFGWLTRSMFSKLSHVAAQTPTYADRFRKCGCSPSRVSVSGNLKFDNVAFDPQEPRVEELRSLLRVQDKDRIVIVGSTQEPEEMLALDSYLELRDEFPNLKLIVVPRHPDRFKHVYNQFETVLARDVALDRIRLQKRSEIHDPLDRWNILIVDSVGELRWWWGLAEVAIVGGSFGSRGGQNMLEPAAYGANVAFGPNTSNFKDITELLLESNAAERIPHLTDMSSWLREQLSNSIPGEKRGLNARRVVAEHQGATRATLDMIHETLGDLAPRESRPVAA